MYKLRRSRLLKFIAGVLVLIFSAGLVFNIVGTYLLMDENLYYASRFQLQQKVYSYVFEYTASDLMRYLNLIEDKYTNNPNYQNYKNSEIQLYESKYLPENSNVHFEIRDEYQNLLLSNEKRENEDNFVFKETFVTHYSHYIYNDNWYVKGNSDSAALETHPPFVTEVDTTYEYDETDEEISHEPSTLEEEYSEESYYEDEYDSEAVALEPRIQTTADILTTDKSAYSVEEYLIINETSGNKTTLKYYYLDSINSNILDYCKDFLTDLPYDITEFSFRQEDFYVEVYEWDDGYTEIYPKYNAVDNIPPNSFTTTLLTDGKEIEFIYTYNGSLILSEFRDRLKYISLNSSLCDESTTYTYTQKGNTQLFVTAFVPVYSAYVKDAYYYAEILVDMAMNYKDNIIPITLLYIFGFLISIAYIFWSAGYIPKHEKAVARGLHGIPFDLYLCLTILSGAGCIAIIDTTDDLFIFLGCAGLLLSALFFIYTLPVRIRAKTLRTNNILYKTSKLLRAAYNTVSDSSKGKAAVFIPIAAFAFFSGISVLYLLGESAISLAFLLFSFSAAAIPVLYLILTGLVSLHNGAKAISMGDIAYRIKTSLLFGPMKKHAEYLNSINNAVNKAVDERMKSENMKTELITNVSHDLKTPLTSIVNYVALLKTSDINDEKALEYINVIDRQSQRLKKLTTDIVDASKAATGNIEVKAEKTALNVILLQTNGEYIERLSERNLTLIQEIPDKDITVITDGRLLWRVIDNLMNNICKYSMQGTRVYLSLWETDNKVYISFRNISSEKLNVTPENLTERFVRGDSSRNTEGSGLGLSIAKSLTELIGGSFSIVIDGDLFKVTLSFPVMQ